MNHPKLEFQFEGSLAESDAQALADLVSREFPTVSTKFIQEHRYAPTAGTRDLPTALAIIALVCTLPGAVNDSIALADRLELRKKLSRLVAWAKERRARRLANPFVALSPHGMKTPLDQARPEQLVDTLIGPADSAQPRRG